MSAGWRCYRMAVLDKLTYLLHSGSDTFDSKVKRNSTKMRRILATKYLLRGKNQAEIDTSL